MENIKNMNLPDNYQLINLDVTYLFKNVNLELVIRTINKYWDQLIACTWLDLTTFIVLITFCYNTSYFTL